MASLVAAALLLPALTSQQDPGEVQDWLNRPFAPVSPPTNMSAHCLEHSRAYLHELANDTLWALEMFDSSAKLQSGLGVGNLANFGDYDECLGAVGSGFQGQHCTASITLPARDGGRLWQLFSVFWRADEEWQLLDKTLSWGVCVPSTCSAGEVEASLRERLQAIEPVARVRVRPEDCRVSAPQPLSAAELAFLIFVIAMSLLLVVATVFDVYNSARDTRKNDLNGLQRGLVAFSVRANISRLLTTTVPRDTMTCLNGIRVLSMLWVIVLHNSLLFTNKYALRNSLRLIHVLYDNALMLLLNGSLATDSFLLLGGLLLSYSFLKQADSSCCSVIKFIVCRYIRLTPPYAAVIFFYATLLYRMGDGPLWYKLIGTQRDLCVRGWWTNILYINNYLNGTKLMCFKPGWYLAVDMQLFLLSLLVLWSLRRWPSAGNVLLVLALTASIATPAAIAAAYHLPGQLPFGLIGAKSEIEDLLYWPAHARASPYLLGLALGRWLHGRSTRDVPLPKWAVTAGWTLSLVVMAAVLQGAEVFVLQTRPQSVLESSAYAGLSRFSWSLGLSWLIFACVKGFGGPVNTILSAGVMVPLSKLSYCVYLCHYMVLLARAGSMRAPGHRTVYSMASVPSC
ncbi:nose resistant to fluoxetine protein 6-like [Bacillus rossius redtenbacheri]|uniref:nose resistant to fluoxetine protein 6-like n=1 Tax=Bacillus rossius redtenbacheri TaxID=93214 RepID=UPI002FDDF7CB